MNDTILISISDFEGHCCSIAELTGKVENLAVEDAKMANEIAIESAVTPPFHASHIAFPVYLSVLGLN